MFLHHQLVDLFAALNLGDQLPPRVGKLAQEPFVPQARVGVAPLWPLSRSDADEHADLATGPLVDRRLVEGGDGWVEGAGPVVVEYRLTDLDRLEGQADGARRPAGFPNLAVKF